MKTYEVLPPEEVKYFVKNYREVVEEGKEAEAFLGTNARYRIRQNYSMEVDSTDIVILIEYCLYPLYMEGDTDIARRAYEILKEFSLSTNFAKLDKVTDFISIQRRLLQKYTDLPFVIETDELVANIINSISRLTPEQKESWEYQGLCNLLDVNPLYRASNKEKVDQILAEFKEKYYTPPKVVKSVAEVWPVVLDTTKIDAIGVVDGHLELLLIDENQWILSLEEEHLLKLQEKINNYIYYLESKQYVASYGDDFDKKFIYLTFQYHPSKNGLAFLDAVQKVLAPTDMSLKIEMPD